MILIFLLAVFAAMVLVSFATRGVIALWPDSLAARALTFTFV